MKDKDKNSNLHTVAETDEQLSTFQKRQSNAGSSQREKPEGFHQRRINQASFVTQGVA